LGLVSEQEYQDQLYFLQKQGLAQRLALLEAAGKGETKEAANIRAAIGKVEGDYTKKKKDQEELAKSNLKMAAQDAHLLVEGLQQVEDMLDKKSAAYETFKAARKAAELAELSWASTWRLKSRLSGRQPRRTHSMVSPPGPLVRPRACCTPA
jgi:dTDP-4-amino-4,6-dideoxygalactose transaminase